MADDSKSLLERLTQNVADRQQAAEARGARPKYPRGWEPHVTTTADGLAEAVSTIFREPNQDERDLITGWLLDPDAWEIIPGTLLVNRWQQHDACDDWLYQYKAKLQSRSHIERVDVDSLLALVETHDPAPKIRSKGDGSLVVCLSDWQIGKGAEGTGGSGVEKTIEAIKQMIVDVEARILELISIGRPIGCLYVAGLGDMIEQCSGNYAIQTFTVELNHRDQMKVTVRLLIEAIKRWSKLVERVVVLAVGGNHGEHRQNGKKFTDDADNDDVAVFETVALVLNENPEAYGHVSFLIPDEDLVVTVEISGKIVSFTHGHLKGGGGKFPQQGQWAWWQGQMGGQLPAGDADILVTAHFHHFSVIDHGPRVHLQCPAMDCGSKWFKDMAGKDSKRGTLTFYVGPDGLDDIKVV